MHFTPAPARELSEWERKFEQVWDEYVIEMTTGELQQEREWLQSYFDSCAESGDGISTKDSVKMYRIAGELQRRGVRLW
jgi:hypothetical protein